MSETPLKKDPAADRYRVVYVGGENLQDPYMVETVQKELISA